MLICPDFSSCRVVVVGDVMLDRYWHGDTSRISPEAPVPVVKIERHEDRVGGAANVAVNVQAMGAVTTLMGIIGEDEAGQTLVDLTTQTGVQCKFVKSYTAKTTLKLRVLGRHQQLIRLDFEDKAPSSSQMMLEPLSQVIQGADILILSDYAKGVISDPQALIDIARRQGIRVLVDPKNPDLTIYRGAQVLTPNLGEFEAMVGACHTLADIENKGQSLVEKLQLEGLLVTRGSHGMSLIQKNQRPLHIPAQAREVFDITGAGDTVIAVLGASLACGASLHEAAQLANLGAGIVVGRLGTATITKQELQATLKQEQELPFLQGILSKEALCSEVKRRKQSGNKIVMTNGCFDILHAGHVTYLNQARALGDCLIVAVNEDESVKRLKGQSRPINSLAQRMQVLASLGCVDYVVSFQEETPQQLIADILPHILVKGGDYLPEQIAGGKEVIHNGGQVKILPFVPGCSTTQLIEKMKISVMKKELSHEEVGAVVE